MLLQSRQGFHSLVHWCALCFWNWRTHANVSEPGEVIQFDQLLFNFIVWCLYNLHAKGQTIKKHEETIHWVWHCNPDPRFFTFSESLSDDCSKIRACNNLSYHVVSHTSIMKYLIILWYLRVRPKFPSQPKPANPLKSYAFCGSYCLHTSLPMTLEHNHDPHHPVPTTSISFLCAFGNFWQCHLK